MFHKLGQRRSCDPQPFSQDLSPLLPGAHGCEDQQREPAAMIDFGKVRAEKGTVKNQEPATQQQGCSHRPMPALNGLHGEGKSSGDNGLRGDNGGHGRHNNQGIQSPTRGHEIEWIDDGFRVPEQQGSLAEVIQQQRRGSIKRLLLLLNGCDQARPAASSPPVGISLPTHHSNTSRNSINEAAKLSG